MKRFVAIVLAFLVARSVVKCGLGARIGHLLVSRFGRSTLGLSYSIFLVDAIIAPAFPSNTARSGVIFPLAFSLADAVSVADACFSAAAPGAGAGVPCGVPAAIAISANPLGTEIARTFGVEIGFGSWLLASSVPTLTAMVLMPLVLYRVMTPELTSTPQAPAAARNALAALGPLRRDEKVVLVAFVGMVTLWASASTLKLDSTAVAFLGLGGLLASGVLTLEHGHEGDVRRRSSGSPSSSR